MYSIKAWKNLSQGSQTIRIHKPNNKIIFTTVLEFPLILSFKN